MSAQRFLQAIRLDYHWLVGHGVDELGVNEIEASATFALPLFYEDAPELMGQYVKAFEKVWARKSELAEF